MFKSGTRVEIPSYLNAWTQGDRYGATEGYTRRGMVRVRLDKSDCIMLCDPDELTEPRPGVVLIYKRRL